jgi:hypothetical protein
MIWRDFLQRTTTMSRVVAVVLGAMVCLRFGVAGFQTALAVSEPRAAPRPVPHGARARALASAAASASATPRQGEEGEALRVTLAVSAGPARSLVLVNGQRMGKSPFLGDLSCKRGHDVRIEIVPESEPAMRFIRRCKGGTIEISRREDPAVPITTSEQAPR